MNTQTMTPERAATPSQVSFIAQLLDERDLFKDDRWFDAVNAMDADEYAAYIERVKEQVKTVTVGRASGIIRRLLALPRKTQAAQPSNRGAGYEVQLARAEVPAGHYAVDGPEGSVFYRVDKPTKGRWDGYTFVRQQSGDNHLRISKEVANWALVQIYRDGTEKAAKRYGKELGRCSCCNRTLTDPASIEAGIGPVCAGKRGWSY